MELVLNLFVYNMSLCHPIRDNLNSYVFINFFRYELSRRSVGLESGNRESHEFSNVKPFFFLVLLGNYIALTRVYEVINTVVMWDRGLATILIARIRWQKAYTNSYALRCDMVR